MADEAIALDPDQIWFYSNRAHALMMLGREDEARAIYLKYRGAEKAQGDRPWDDLILADFAELRKAGVSNRLMDEIANAFASPGSSGVPAQAAR